jgi:peptide/nickel transport system substrate-binding protein
LREGVGSNYGNPLTAADVKYTFDRKFEVKGAGGLMTGVMGLQSKDQVKVEVATMWSRSISTSRTRS